MATAKKAPAKAKPPAKTAKAKPSGNKTVAETASVVGFLKAWPDEKRREEAAVLLKIFDRATGWGATMWGPSIIGYGRYAYTYDSGRTGTAPLVGFSPRKGAISLYLYTSTPEGAALLAKMGKTKKAVACVYVNKLADIDLAVLEKLVKLSVVQATKDFKAKGWSVSGS